MRAAETPVVPGVLATMAAAAVWHAATAGAEDWKEFLALMGESRLVHVTSECEPLERHDALCRDVMSVPFCCVV